MPMRMRRVARSPAPRLLIQWRTEDVVFRGDVFEGGRVDVGDGADGAEESAIVLGERCTSNNIGLVSKSLASYKSSRGDCHVATWSNFFNGDGIDYLSGGAQ
jgi:hypothetical protein